MTTTATAIDGWKLRALALSIVLAMLGYLGFSVWGGWDEVVRAFSIIGLGGTAIALGMSLLNYGLRFVRWQMYLYHLGYTVRPLASLRIYLSGFALTTTPGKAGEAFRGLLLKHHGMPFPASFAAFVSERLSDLLAIVLLSLLGLLEYPQARWIVVAGFAAIVFAMVILSSSSLLLSAQKFFRAGESKFRKLGGHVVGMLLEARRCHSPGVLGIATVISIVAWGAEAVALYWVLQWLGADISLSFAVFVYALSMLAGALSFLPGGLGGAEAVMVSLLSLKGMSMPDAVAATVFIRLATLWFAVVIGIVALYQSQNGERV